MKANRKTPSHFGEKASNTHLKQSQPTNQQPSHQLQASHQTKFRVVRLGVEIQFVQPLRHRIFSRCQAKKGKHQWQHSKQTAKHKTRMFEQATPGVPETSIGGHSSRNQEDLCFFFFEGAEASLF